MDPKRLSDSALQVGYLASFYWETGTSADVAKLAADVKNRFIEERMRREENFKNSPEGKRKEADLLRQIEADDKRREGEALQDTLSESGVEAARIGVIEDLKEVRRTLVDRALQRGLHGADVAAEIKAIMRDQSISALLAAGASQVEAERGWQYIEAGIDANLNY